MMPMKCILAEILLFSLYCIDMNCLMTSGYCDAENPNHRRRYFLKLKLLWRHYIDEKRCVVLNSDRGPDYYKVRRVAPKCKSTH